MKKLLLMLLLLVSCSSEFKVGDKVKMRDDAFILSIKGMPSIAQMVIAKICKDYIYEIAVISEDKVILTKNSCIANPPMSKPFFNRTFEKAE